MTEPFELFCLFYNMPLYLLLSVSYVFGVYIVYVFIIILCAMKPIIRIIKFTTTWGLGY